jgi:protein-S-isoprenylcysteine O-methyltransferase Ste14
VRVRPRLHRPMLLRRGQVSAVTGAWAALALYVVGLVLAFGVRTLLQVRRTGTSGFHGISGRPGSLTWWGGVLFPAAVLLGLAAPVLVLVGATPRIEALAHPLITIAGFVLGIAGLAVVLFAQGAMGASWRIGVDDSERTDLVTDGL